MVNIVRRCVLLVLVSIFIGSVFVSAEPVTMTMVKKVGETKLAATNTVEKLSFQKRGGIDYKSHSISNIRELKDGETGEILAYALDLKPKGFIVISADTDITPVIAHSFESNFIMEDSRNNVILHMVTWDMENRLEAIPVTSEKIKRNNNELWSKYLSSEEAFLAKLKSTEYPPPLLGTIKWTQGYPYNENCPEDKGKNCKVGCVATAMAQIIYYHRYPSSVTFGTSDIYFTETKNIYVYAPDASIASIDYDNERSTAPDLSFACGVSIQMDYTAETYGSEAAESDVAGALKNKFNYASARWRNLWGLYNEKMQENINDGLPVLLAIRELLPDLGAGHAVVVDGYYPPTNQFHLNCGGDEEYNTWYNFAEELPYEFDFIYGGVVDIKPTGESPSPDPNFIIADSGDYNGDGISDIGLFRSSSGLWSIRGLTRVYFGSSSDIPVPGDYDGDGTTDVGVFRQDSGLWAIRGVARGYFGSAADLPAQGDYNGNGTCDMGIFRGSSGLWAVKGVTRVYFGTSDDIPVPGDYNGDGNKDIALYRSSSGLWAIKGISRMYFGSSIDGVLPGDYDGDGIWDPGIFRPTTGLWAIKGVTRRYYGSESCIPLNCDLNANGQSDIAVFKPYSGLWAVSGVTRCYYGTNWDIPVTGPPLAAHSGGLLTEDWESGINTSKWKKWGSPEPIIKAGLGRGGGNAFDANGDSAHQSGVVSYQNFTLNQGLTIEYWVKAHYSYIHWQNIVVGMSEAHASDYSGTASQPGYVCSIEVQPEGDGDHIRYIVGSDNYEEDYVSAIDDDTWHKYKIVINQNGTVSFYKDDIHKFTSTGVIEFSTYNNQPLVISGRSYDHYQLVDDVVVH